MNAKSKPRFNVATFLATVDGGRTISTYRKNRRVFLQGDLADSVFYIQEGQVKVYVVSEQGKEAIVAIHDAFQEALEMRRTAYKEHRLSDE